MIIGGSFRKKPKLKRQNSYTINMIVNRIIDLPNNVVIDCQSCYDMNDKQMNIVLMGRVFDIAIHHHHHHFHIYNRFVTNS